MSQLGKIDRTSAFSFGGHKQVSLQNTDDRFTRLGADKGQQVLKPAPGPDLSTMVWELHETMIESMDAAKLRAADPPQARKLV